MVTYLTYICQSFCDCVCVCVIIELLGDTAEAEKVRQEARGGKKDPLPTGTITTEPQTAADGTQVTTKPPADGATAV